MRFLVRTIFLVTVIVIVVLILHIFNNEDTKSSVEPMSSTAVSNDFDYGNRYLQDSYEKWINNYTSNILPGLGDLGKPAFLDVREMPNESKLFSKKAINVWLSNKISLERRLPDVRFSVCRNISYDIEHLPTASVVIIFHNEAWSVLLRTVYSVLRETPPTLLKEIILVDDKSDEEELKEILSYYIKTRLPLKVQLVRLTERQGLIRARLQGAKRTSGDVLVFLDAHCEVTKEWLHPMLLRIKEKRNAVVSPIVDIISDKTLEYKSKIIKTLVGGFTWSGTFVWVDIPSKLMVSKESIVAPIATPTMSGGLFAIDREYFWEFGSYDEMMEGWGGENLEISFRTWQCGGSLEIIPCSRVGHIFREFIPYKLPNNTNTEIINLSRTVNVWMDDYSRLFYLYNKRVKFGDIKDRLELRKKLKCRSFKWYLDNIYPEKFIPDENVKAYGRIRSAISNLCIEGKFDETQFYKLKVAVCKIKPIYKQFLSLTNTGLLRTEMRCAVVVKDTLNIEMNGCDNLLEYKKWKLLEDGSIVHLPSRLCLDITGLKPGQDIVASPCSGSPGQIFKFDYYANY